MRTYSQQELEDMTDYAQGQGFGWGILTGFVVAVVLFALGMVTAWWFQG